MKIIPAPLSQTRESCREQFAKLLPHCQHYQIDIQDGVYVPSHTISVGEYLTTIDQCMRGQATRRTIALDYHLMVTDYAPVLAQIATLTPQYPDIHLRTIYVHTNIPRSLLTSHAAYPLSLALSPPDMPGDWSEYLSGSAYAQVMTIYPGPQGQPLMPDMLVKIGQMREINPRLKICIDGAVSDVTLPVILDRDVRDVPDEIGVGSYLSRAPAGEIATRLRVLNEIMGM